MREKFKLWNIVQVHVNFFSISKLKKKKKIEKRKTTTKTKNELSNLLHKRVR